MGVSRSDRNRSSSQEVNERIFWEEIEKLQKEIRLLQPKADSAPIIVGHPTPVAATAGGVAVFAVAVVGPAPLYYQWLRDGVDIPDAIGPTLTITNVGSGDAANYSVRVRNQVGEVVSNAAALVVTTVGADVPIGGILMWAGLLADIPANYALCDGTAGTPDLRDRFVMGVRTSATDPGATGGNKRHIHSIATADVVGNKATNAKAPIGGNTGSSGSTTDAHTTTAVQSGAGTTVVTGPASHTVAGHTHPLPAETGDHEHSLDGKTTEDRKTDNTAFADDYEALPPWFEVAFIQRVS